jgi:hypothetical protein
MVDAKWEQFYQVMLVALAHPPDAALKAWRKTQIGRGNVLRAKDFDTALRAAVAYGESDPLDLAVWMSRNGFAPVLVRPDGHRWSVKERAFIESVKMHGLAPLFMTYDEEAIVRVPGPHTSYRDLLRLGWRDE